MNAQQVNLQELVTELAKLKDEHDQPKFSPEMLELIEAGIHHVLLPDTLKTKAAESFQLAYEGIGGLARLIRWADRYPGNFYKLLARQTIPTIGPVLPPPGAVQQEVWPEWITSQRLAYAIDKPAPDTEDTDG